MSSKFWSTHFFKIDYFIDVKCPGALMTVTNIDFENKIN